MRSFAPQQIVLATDLSGAAAEALRTSLLISDAFGADLTVISAEEVEPGRSAARQEAESRLQRWIESRAPGRAVATRVAEGPPVEALLRAADEMAADLIVIGANVRHGIERLYLGHFAEGVLHKSTRPVLTVRRGMRAIRSILCGVDCTPDSVYALATAVEWGEVFHAQVTAVHVVEPGLAGAANVGQLDKWLPPELRVRCQCKELVIRGGVSERLAAFAGALHADLLIVGGTRNRAAGETVLPTATDRAVRRARCAVLAMIEEPAAAASEVVASEELVAV